MLFLPGQTPKRSVACSARPVPYNPCPPSQITTIHVLLACGSTAATRPPAASCSSDRRRRCRHHTPTVVSTSVNHALDKPPCGEKRLSGVAELPVRPGLSADVASPNLRAGYPHPCRPAQFSHPHAPLGICRLASTLETVSVMHRGPLGARPVEHAPCVESPGREASSVAASLLDLPISTVALTTASTISAPFTSFEFFSACLSLPFSAFSFSLSIVRAHCFFRQPPYWDMRVHPPTSQDT